MKKEFDINGWKDMLTPEPRKLSAREMKIKREMEYKADLEYLKEINRVDNNNSHDDQ